MDYWNSFWKSQATTSQGQNPHSQVLRTLHRAPVSSAVFSDILSSVRSLLRVDQKGTLLDLCCGNGEITRGLFSDFSNITAIDLAPEFIASLQRGAPPHVTARTGDAKKIDFPDASFDRILVYAGLQYFSEAEAVALFCRLRRWIRPGGIAVVGDIPDAALRWAFFDSEERKRTYFEGLSRGVPIVGNWFDAEWLKHLADYAGFAPAVVTRQSRNLPYHHYRIDLVLNA